jgi:hypothetical protein
MGAADGKRTWTDSSGQFHVDAMFVSLEDGVVTLKKDDETEVQIPADKLSKGDQEFIARLQKERPVPAANPFVEVRKPAENAKAADSAAKTRDFVSDFGEKLRKRSDEVASEDTSEKKRAAHERLLKSFSDEIKDKPFTFRFPIKDVVYQVNGGSQVTVDFPEDIRGPDRAISEFRLPLKKEETLKVASGDTLVISGKGLLSYGGYLGNLPQSRERGAICVFTFFPAGESSPGYGICVRDFKYKIEPKK